MTRESSTAEVSIRELIKKALFLIVTSSHGFDRIRPEFHLELSPAVTKSFFFENRLSAAVFSRRFPTRQGRRCQLSLTYIRLLPDPPLKILLNGGQSRIYIV